MRTTGGADEAREAGAIDRASPGEQSAGRAIGRAALVLMSANLAVSLLGYVRLAVIGAVYGQNRNTDAFFAASLLPQMFYDIAIGAAISAALIPTFTEIFERRGTEELRRTIGSVLGLAWLVLAAVTAGLVVAAPRLMTIILLHNPQHLGGAGVGDAVRIARVIVLSLFFLGTSAVLLSSLYSVRRFTVSAFAGAMYHLGVIAGAILLARPLGILALPVGAVAGAASQALMQAPSLIRHIGPPRIRLGLTPEVRRILRLYAPVAAGLVVSLIAQIVDAGFKWQLGKGAYTAMTYATTLTQFPIGIAVAGLSFAILPSISAAAAFGEMDQFKATLASGLRLVLFLTIPAAVGYLVLATPISALVFQHHKITAADTGRTAIALVGYAIQIPFVGIDQLLIFAFYARKNTITPMLVGVIGVGIYIGSALLLLPRLHILGLALANTIQNSLHAVILFVLLVGAIGSLQVAGLLPGIARICVAAAVMACGAILVLLPLQRLFPHGDLLGRFVTVVVPIGVGAGLYLVVLLALGSEELDLMGQVILQRARPARG